MPEVASGKKQIETYLEALLTKYLPAGIDKLPAELIPPTKEQVAGTYRIGTVLYAEKPLYDFGLREDEWIQHVGIFGRTGAGKTNLGFLIFTQLHKKNKPVLVFDWKRNYRDLLALPEFQDVEVYTIGRNIAPLTFNPLIPPPGTKPRTWIKKLTEVIAHAYCLGNGVMYLLQQAMDAVYEETGVYEGLLSRFPTFRDVLEKLRKREARGREAGWLSSTLRALASLCFGDMDSLVNQGENQTLEHLLSKSAILELDALTQQDKVMFIEAMLLWFHQRRMAEPEREVFKHAILIEESHHVLSNERRNLFGGQSVMEITFREIREFGEALIIIDQHPSQISLPALGNTYCTICLNLKHSRDVNAMSQCMLVESQEKDILGSLEVGQAVVKLQGRIPRAFLIRIPEFEIEKGAVTDEMVTKRMQRIVRTGSAGLPAAEAPDDHPVTSTAHLQKQAAMCNDKTNLMIVFLKDVAAYPESGIAVRYKRLGISVRQGQKLQAQALTQRLIEEQEERTRTGRLKVVRLTEKGRQFLEKS